MKKLSYSAIETLEALCLVQIKCKFNLSDSELTRAARKMKL